jgi:hypothetical protein
MNTLEFCKKYIKNHTINSDNTVDVNGNVDLYNRLGDMKKLPVKFGKVSGSFSCGGNKLTTLEGCPKYIGGNFYGDILTHHILGSVQGKIFYYHKHRRIVI